MWGPACSRPQASRQGLKEVARRGRKAAARQLAAAAAQPPQPPPPAEWRDIRRAQGPKSMRDREQPLPLQPRSAGLGLLRHDSGGGASQGQMRGLHPPPGADLSQKIAKSVSNRSASSSVCEVAAGFTAEDIERWHGALIARQRFLFDNRNRKHTH